MQPALCSICRPTALPPVVRTLSQPLLITSYALWDAAEVMFGSRPTAIYAQHLLGSSGHRKHHGWRDHHPHSRSGAHSHRAESSSSERQQAAEGCAECGAVDEPDSKQHLGSGHHGSGQGENSADSLAAGAAAAHSHSMRASSSHAFPDSSTSSKDGTKTGHDDRSSPLDVTWNVTPAEEPDSSSDVDVTTSRKASVQRHRNRVRTRPCAACEARDK